MKISGILAGVAGEYLVAGELSRRGYIASITLRNTRGVDILVSDDEAKKNIAIQVKTNQGKTKWWILDKKAESYFADNLFYVFVNLNSGDAPDYFIVPSKVVAKQIRDTHSKWLKTPGKTGKPHKDNPIRQFEDKTCSYLNRWDLLNL
jgi:hypothetical protein